MYLAFVNEFISGAFSVEHAEALCQEAHDLIEPYVVGENGEQKGYTNLNKPQYFDKGLSEILTQIETRQEVARDFLADEGFTPSDIVISEILYNPAANQGDGNSEFVEICNTGAAAVDLSGYAFSDGIAFTFPQNTSIAAGEYIVVAADAKSHDGLGCQVFQWKSGNLSNSGEAIQLSDAEGIQIDYVIYSDAAPWPESADGGGSSLEVIDLRAANSLPDNWKASSAAGGTPGRSNS